MDKIDIHLAQKNTLTVLEKLLKNLSFQTTISNGVLTINHPNLTLNGIDDDIFAHFTCSEGGMAYFQFVFDKLEKTLANLLLVNEFNAKQTYFKCHINGNNNLVIDNNFPVYSADDFAKQCLEFLLRGGDLSKDQLFKEITFITK